jgi:hypothetical protein
MIWYSCSITTLYVTGIEIDISKYMTRYTF